MMKRNAFLGVFFTLLIAFILALPLFAPLQGIVKGVVADTKGNPIEEVKITISSFQYTAVNYIVKSNKKGEFIQIGLQPDTYQIKAEKDGYFPVFIERHVGIGAMVEIKVEMEEGTYFVGQSPGEKDFKRGNELFLAGNAEEAAKAYAEAVAKEPGEPIYLNNLGISYTRLERYDEAAEAFLKLLELQPNSISANRSLGQIYGFKKQFEEAIPYFTKAAELSPNDPEIHYDMGASLMNLGELDKAFTCFAQAVKIKPDFALPYYQLGMIYVNQNNKEEAIRHLEKFLELAPDDPNAPIAKQVLDYLKSS